METQNVSAQVYKKQLPDQFDGQFGCMYTDPFLSTCVQDVSSDKSIEDAFQKQLDLSLYYKNKKVFDSMKQEYMSQTMEGKNEQPEPEIKRMPVMSKLPANPTVGPRDFLQNMIGSSKSSFGSTNYGSWIFIFVFILAALWAYIYKNRNAPWVIKLKGIIKELIKV